MTNHATHGRRTTRNQRMRRAGGPHLAAVWAAFAAAPRPMHGDACAGRPKERPARRGAARREALQTPAARAVPTSWISAGSGPPRPAPAFYPRSFRCNPCLCALSPLPAIITPFRWYGALEAVPFGFACLNVSPRFGHMQFCFKCSFPPPLQKPAKEHAPRED